jgi:hypothetical protein
MTYCIDQDDLILDFVPEVMETYQLKTNNPNEVLKFIKEKHKRVADNIYYDEDLKEIKSNKNKVKVEFNAPAYLFKITIYGKRNSYDRIARCRFKGKVR